MNRQSIRFLLLFFALLAIFFLAIQTDLAQRLVTVPVSRILATVSGLLLSAIGIPNLVNGTRIDALTGFSANIVEGCTGIDVIAIVAAAVVAFPGGWRPKAIGLLLAIPVVQTLNLVRIVSLYWLGSRGNALFDTFHLYVWQTVLILLSLGLWLLWAEWFVLGPARRAPHDRRTA